MLLPNETNNLFHARTRAKAKMYEYAVPQEQHINLEGISLNDLLDLTIGMLGDLTAGAVIKNLNAEKHRLLFSAQYLTALVESREISHSHATLKLLSASAFYLSGYPGSSDVVLAQIQPDQINSLDPLELILLSVLRRQRFLLQDETIKFYVDINRVRDAWDVLLNGEGDYAQLDSTLSTLRANIYSDGEDKDLLVIDIMKTIILHRFSVSAHTILGEYSDASLDSWAPYLVRPNSLKEFWPSQVRLAQHGVFRGVSAVVQMPTSAGKTRAVELIIRGSFLSHRCTLAVVVAPFRALCQEIYNDFLKHFSEDRDVQVGLVSDVLQEDLSIEIDNQKTILILTPEKLDFLLRHNRELATQIGLIIYDEGHLFDDGTRGPKYELLLASLKQQLQANAQVVLISAVISNAQEIKDWLMGQNGVLVDGKDLSPTNRSIAFTDWGRTSRFLRFVDDHDINRDLFFVPSVLQSYLLTRKERERSDRFYPSPDRYGRYSASQIAGFLGCRLASAGLSAVFTGKKVSAQKIVKEIVDAYERDLPLAQPSEFSGNNVQAEKVTAYIRRIIGEESINAKASELGILMHHGNIPHGLRLVTEHALQHNQFKMVVCTSTLAQGVNLPIRYLVIAADRQGQEKIKIRDFHNLMGRAGRSGKYTEGTVIFANSEIYRSRAQGRGNFRWHSVENMLNSNNSEPSKSRLLILLEEPPETEEERIPWEIELAATKNEINSYLMNALLEVDEIREMEQIVTQLSQNTLGYAQLENEEKKLLFVSIFLEMGSSIMTRTPDLNRRKVFAKVIVSIEQAEHLAATLQNKSNEILDINNDLLTVLWPELYENSKHSILRSFSQNDALTLCEQWLSGDSFMSILESAIAMDRGEGRRSLTIGNIVDLCEGGFSYDISTLLGTLAELLALILPEEQLQNVILRISTIQKAVKYGIPRPLESTVYELGFADRNLSIEIATIIDNPDFPVFRNEAIDSIRNSVEIREIIESRYPEYFLSRLDNLRRQ